MEAQAPRQMIENPIPVEPRAMLHDRVLTNLRAWMEQWTYERERGYVRVIRTYPKMHAGVAAHGFLEDLYQPVDEDYLKDTWGGGTYLVVATQPYNEGAAEMDRRMVVVPGNPVWLPGPDGKRLRFPVEEGNDQRFTPMGMRGRAQPQPEPEPEPMDPWSPPPPPPAWGGPAAGIGGQGPGFAPGYPSNYPAPYQPPGYPPVTPPWGGGPGWGPPPTPQPDLLQAVREAQGPERKAMEMVERLQMQQADLARAQAEQFAVREAALREEFAKVLASQTAPLQASLESYREQVLQLRSELADRVNTVRGEWETRLREAGDRHASEIRGLIERHDKDALAREEKFRQEQANLRDAHRAEREQLQRELDRLRDEHRKDDQVREEKVRREIKEIEERNARREEQLRADQRRDLDQAAAKFESEKTRLEGELRSLRDERSRLEDRASQAEQKLRGDFDRREDRYQADLNRKEDLWNAERDRLRAEVQTLRETAQANLDGKLRDAQKEAETRLADLRASLESRLKEQKEDLKREEQIRVESTQAAIRAELLPQVKALETEAARLREENTRMHAELSQAQAEARDRKDPTQNLIETKQQFEIMQSMFNGPPPAPEPVDDSTLGKIMKHLPNIKNNVLDPVLSRVDAMTQAAREAQDQQQRLREAALVRGQQIQAARLQAMQAGQGQPPPQPVQLQPQVFQPQPQVFQPQMPTPARVPTQPAPMSVPVAPTPPQPVVATPAPAPASAPVTTPAPASLPVSADAPVEIPAQLLEYLNKAVSQGQSVQDLANEIKMGLDFGMVDKNVIQQAFLTRAGDEVASELSSLSVNNGFYSLGSPRGEQYLRDLHVRLQEMLK